MKKFFIILCIIMMLPLYAFAASPSPTIKSTVRCEPKLTFMLADQTTRWENVLERLDKIELDENYYMLEAVLMFYDKPYKELTWYLPIKVTSEHEPFIRIITDDAIEEQEVSVTENGAIVMDMTEYKPGVYYVCFYIKGT